MNLSPFGYFSLLILSVKISSTASVHPRIHQRSWEEIKTQEWENGNTSIRRQLWEATALGNKHLNTTSASNTDNNTPDATFAGYPLTKKTIHHHSSYDIPTTLSHCVGENYQNHSSWMYRSCHFQFFCFDTFSKDFVIFENVPDEQVMQQYVNEQQPFLDVSQAYLRNDGVGGGAIQQVSIGGIHRRWDNTVNNTDANFDIQNLRWFPQLQIVPNQLTYWELPSNVVLVPFHSMNAVNPENLVWDDFLPIYTLLTMFELEEDNELLLMRYVLHDDVTQGLLWGSSCDTHENVQHCQNMFRKFLPLMVGLQGKYVDMPTIRDFEFTVTRKEPTTATSTATSLVCAKQGVAGIGALTDHGTEKLHGWEDRDYSTTQNHGRGGMIYEFRNFLMRNIGISTNYHQKPPYRIVFSDNGSSIGHHGVDFSKHQTLLQQHFHPSYAVIEFYDFRDLSLQEQVSIASQTSVLITSCGGGSVTSMFLPRGSSVVIFYLEQGGIVHGKPSGRPARLDWDLFNNMAYLKVHWLPSSIMTQDDQLRSFVSLIQHELDGLIRERSYNHFFFG